MVSQLLQAKCYFAQIFREIIFLIMTLRYGLTPPLKTKITFKHKLIQTSHEFHVQK